MTVDAPVEESFEDSEMLVHCGVGDFPRPEECRNQILRPRIPAADPEQQHLEHVLAVFSGRLIRHTRRQYPRRSRKRFVSSVAIVSVECFTSTSWQPDRVFEPYNLTRSQTLG